MRCDQSMESHVIMSRIASAQEQMQAQAEGAERIHEVKNGPPRAQGSCEAWQSKETRTPGDRTDLQTEWELNGDKQKQTVV